MRAAASHVGLIVAAAVLLAVAAEAAAEPPRRPKAPHRLLVISVDGLDWRYLKDADRLGLRIPTLRRLMAEGDVADGVVGENPTITWPAHTTLITGVPPRQHGILGNGRPGSETGSRYFDTSMLTAPTLWQAAKAAGLTVGSVTWPVTLSHQIDFDLPEYFARGHGEGMDLATLAAKSTPGLIERIGACYPAFLEPTLTDRTRTLAALYMTRTAGADLTLLHLMDLDAVSHAQGPFTPAADGTLEYTDELLATLIDAAPSDLDVALVSDHGFEKIDRELNVPAWLAAQGSTTWLSWLESWLSGHSTEHGLVVMAGLIATHDAVVAQAFAREAGRPDSALGRLVPRAELERWAPELQNVLAAYEPPPHVLFVADASRHELYEHPREPGSHHFWPGRADFRSVFVLWGPGVAARHEPEISMLSIYARLAAPLGLPPASQAAAH